ncbi:MAG: peptidoglycan DD-metalloendopeptidase family protein [Caldicoprobacterales bacterium]|jgi:murein DD-endopeptidase MepM/ murein hydrolase activator NlpD/prophage antirepressor-like protein|nr:M23 family metallopeptidase [Clostridiales bacterium]
MNSFKNPSWEKIFSKYTGVRPRIEKFRKKLITETRPHISKAKTWAAQVIANIKIWAGKFKAWIVTEIKPRLSKAGKQIVTAVKTGARKFKTWVVTDVKPWISKVGVQIAAGIKNGAVKFKAWIVTEIKPRLSKAGKQVVTAVKTGARKLKTWVVTDVKPWISKVGVQIAAGIKSGAVKLKAWIVTEIKPRLRKAGKQIVTAVKTGAVKFKTWVVTDVKPWISKVGAQIAAGIKSVAGKFKAWIVTVIKPRISKAGKQIVTGINTGAGKFRVWVVSVIKPRISKIKTRLVTFFKPVINKVRAQVITYIKPRFSKIKNQAIKVIKHGINKIRSKIPHIRLSFANIKFFRANIGQLGIILMLGIFLTTGMIGNIEVAASEETIATTIRAHRVLLNGRQAGYVCNRQSAQIVMDEVLQDAAESYGMEVTAEHGLTFEETIITPEQLSTKAELEKSLRQFSEINVNAYTIYADGKIIGTLKSKEDARQVLDNIKALYTEDIARLEDVTFQEEVEILPTPVSFHEIQDTQIIEAEIMEGQETLEEYTIKEGDTFWSISKAFNIDYDELTQMNAGIDPDKLQLGQKIRLSYPKNLLNVVTTEVIVYEKPIAYKTETQKDSSMYTNQSKVIQEGKEGVRQIEAHVIKVNGVEQEREIVSEKVIKEPVNKIVVKGTKTPVTRGSGRLKWPTKGRITSRFGRRWGRLHKGLDIANSKGTPIYAADSGKVIFSGWQGGYGNLVKIDHGGGMVTFYAHMSKRAVSKGSSVSKGQLIGYIGSTGNSTGPHLHFEVRINDSPRNPLKYLP